jgi:mRNA interferase RelE/StbE
LVFRPRAKKDFERLDALVRNQLQKKLRERLFHPRVEADHLRRAKDCYKIKLRKAGVRLIYKVEDDRLVVLVLAIGKREGEEAYEKAERELLTLDD